MTTQTRRRARKHGTRKAARHLAEQAHVAARELLEMIESGDFFAAYDGESELLQARAAAVLERFRLTTLAVTA